MNWGYAQVGGSDNVVAGVCEGSDGDKLSSLAGGGGQRSNTSFQCRNALLEDIDGRLEPNILR